MTRKRWVTGLTMASLIGGTGAAAYGYEADNDQIEQLQEQLDALRDDVDQQRESGFQLTLERQDRVRSGPQMHSLEGRPQPFDPVGVEIGRLNDIRFNMGFHVVGRAQYLHQSNTEVYDAGEDEFLEPSRIGPGMQTGWSNIDFQLNISDDIELFFDGLFATQRHPTRFWGHQGYFYIRQFPEDTPLAAFNDIFQHIDIKAGNFYPNFGNEVHRRSINADVQRNPLIGNPIVSPHGVEPGLEIIHEDEMDGREYGLMVGFGIGAPEQDFNMDRRFSVRGKGWFQPIENFELAYSIYHVDHGRDVDRGTNLFRRERLGSPYSSVWNFGDDDSGSGEGPGQVRIGDGRRLTAMQADLNWDLTDHTFLNSHFGYANASGADPSDATGNERWLYYGADVTHYLTEDLYVAARYTEANARKFLVSSNTGRVGRAQAGAGLWILDGLLFKTEYVYQKAWGFDSETRGVAGNVDVGEDPSFHGIIAELSYSF